jgi:hypothetical protein
MGREVSKAHGVRVMFTPCRALTVSMCWFGVWWGHDTDVVWTGCERMGSQTRRVSFYASLVGGGLRLSGP